MATFHKSIYAFLDEDKHRQVEVAWCAGHRDIAGNEAADKIANCKAAVALDRRGGSAVSWENALRRSREQTFKARITSKFPIREH